MTRSGSCLCGAVTYTVSHSPDRAGACHCGNCRKHSGGIFFGIEIKPDAIAFDGADHIATFASSDWAERGFCKTCGSTLFYRMTAPGPMQGTYHLAFGTLDDTDGIGMEGEIFIDKKPATYAFAGDHATMTEAEFMAMYAPPPQE